MLENIDIYGVRDAFTTLSIRVESVIYCSDVGQIVAHMNLATIEQLEKLNLTERKGNQC